MSTSQTLDRGLSALAMIALAPAPPTIADIAAGLDVHRSIAYRIVRTLEAHRLVERDQSGHCTPGPQLGALARCARSELQSAALDELARLADTTGMTAFLVVADGDDAVTVESVEPASSHVHVVYRPGVRHPLERGAPGLAILIDGPMRPGERVEVTEARSRGWAHTNGEVIAAMGAVAAPVRGTGGAISVVFPSGAVTDPAPLAAVVRRSADAIAARLAPTPHQTRASSTGVVAEHRSLDPLDPLGAR
ncbi:MAG: IclR family transcriptional regulator [Ilumatobacter sp.]|uniref:IclR family transcriptional regulator n=1 Tax=Ilumatobacter sp. TaxID=1967498 RepID=UPI00391B2B96